MLDFSYYLDQITKGVEDLQSLIQAHAIEESAIAFSTPPISKSDEERLIQDDYNTIPVTTLKGEQARRAIQFAFGDLYIPDDNISRRFVPKYPGLLALDCSWEALDEITTRINVAKKEFKASVQLLGDEEEKFRAIHERHQHLITLMAYRQINAFRGDYDAFYFNWSRRPRGESRTKTECEDYLNRSYGTVPKGVNKDAWYQILDNNKTTLSNAKYVKYSFRRPIKLRPECSVRSLDKKMLSYSAGLPFLIAECKQLPRCSELKDYERTEPKTRSGKWTLIIPRLHLYGA